MDNVVSIKEQRSVRNVVGSGTYDRGSILLHNLGAYKVIVATLGVHKNKKSQTAIIEIL